jgi:feruloyl esterase
MMWNNVFGNQKIRRNERMRLVNRLAAGAAFGLIAAWSGLAAAQTGCADLKNLKLDDATIVSAAAVEPGPLKQPEGLPFKVPAITVPAHCEVTGVARPTADSEIDFALWLPPAGAWNSKYMQRGNGGWAGSIQPAVLVVPLIRGYAVSATDDGHRSKNMMMPDASWAIGHPEKLIDFGYRALHETATVSKIIVQAYYGKPQAHAYFSGCSDGGREALMEAQRYPEDFDGIIAGAPANNWTHHFTGFVWNEVALNGKPESKIAIEQLPAIQKAALAACDTLDGVKDGLIEDPRKCQFDPSVLLCRGASGADCLSQPQIDALKKIYAGPKNPRTGQQIYPGYEPGTEAEQGAWGLWIVGLSVQSLFGNTFFGQAVYEDPHWDWRTFDFDRDVALADEKTASILNSYNPDLGSFRDRGGKLIQYHGWGDAAIAPRDSINFYEKVQAFLKRYPDPRSAGSTDIQAFYRLFMVPGLQHCTDGPGPTSFGNDEFAALASTPDDADHDVLLALDRWVTQGVAPDKIIGSGALGADPKSGSKGTPLTRPLCAYPAVARYKGHGDTNAAENFTCATEAAR